MKRDQGPYVGLSYALNDDTKIEEQYEIFGDLSYRHAFNVGLEVMTRVYGRLREFDMLFELYPEGTQLWADYLDMSGPFPVLGQDGIPDGPIPYDLDGDGIPDKFAIYPDGMLGEPAWKERTTGTEVQFDYELFKNNKLTLGGVFEQEKVYDVVGKSNVNTATLVPLDGGFQELSEDLVFTKEADRDIWAVYLQNDWDITPELSLTMGVRYDNYEDFGDTINPRFGLVWLPIQDMNLKLLYGEAFRAPSFNELYQQNNLVRQGNPDLDAEKIRTFEASLGYDFTRHINTRVSYFYSRIKDLITTGDERTPIGAFIFINKGGSETHGVELELRGEYDKDTYAYANYSYQDARDDETGDRLPDVSIHKANFGVNVGLCKYLNINTTVLLRSTKPRAEDDSRNDLPAYELVNLALISHNFLKGLEVFGSIYNLFDKDYADPAPTDTLPDDFPRPGRAYYAGLRYKF